MNLQALKTDIENFTHQLGSSGWELRVDWVSVKPKENVFAGLDSLRDKVFGTNLKRQYHLNVEYRVSFADCRLDLSFSTKYCPHQKRLEIDAIFFHGGEDNLLGGLDKDEPNVAAIPGEDFDAQYNQIVLEAIKKLVSDAEGKILVFAKRYPYDNKLTNFLNR